MSVCYHNIVCASMLVKLAQPNFLICAKMWCLRLLNLLLVDVLRINSIIKFKIVANNSCLEFF